MDETTSSRLLQRALAGEGDALAQLVHVLAPVIQARVARTLLARRVGAASSRNVRQEVEDLAQEIFLVLFADGGRVLGSWQPERGLTLAGFVGMVAERQALSILRSGKRSPWKEDPTLADDLESADGSSDPEEVAASREELRLLLARLGEELSPLGRQLFDLLFLQELPLPEIVARTRLSADAVYAWRSRLRRLARRLLGEVSGKAALPRRTLGGAEA
jgi:RNA polymerase sigma-70 factor, ECF subfamily